MTRPSSIEDLQKLVAQAHAERRRLGSIDVSRLDQVIEHHPEDLTCTVECGLSLANLQSTLKTQGQWLPLDPPFPGRLSLREVIDGNLTGPRRLGFGTLRDYLIGLEIIQADGTRIRSGGRVVKNVAGYDLHKLFIGSRGSLGLPVIATFKLLPLPESEATLHTASGSLEEALRCVNGARNEFPALVALDLCRARIPAEDYEVIIQFAGTEPDVANQRAKAIERGFTDWMEGRWDEVLWRDALTPPARFSVLPSKLGEALGPLAGRAFVARAGNGIIYHDGPPIAAPRTEPAFLLDRLKKAFDPHEVLAPLPEG